MPGTAVSTFTEIHCLLLYHFPEMATQIRQVAWRQGDYFYELFSATINSFL